MRTIFLILTLATFHIVAAQNVNSLILKGNSSYEDKQYLDAEENYKEALELDNQNPVGNFNLGTATYKQERFSDAISQFEKVAGSDNDPLLRAKAYHNIGNSWLEQKDFEKSIGAYKEALKLNPNDTDTKYNLAYAKQMILNQQQQNNDQDQQNQEKQDEQDKKEEEQNKDQQKQEQDNKEEEQNKDQQKQEQDKQDQQGQPDKQDQPSEPQKKNMSPEELERILQALNQDEKKVQQKINEQKATPVKIKIEKDW